VHQQFDGFVTGRCMAGEPTESEGFSLIRTQDASGQPVHLLAVYRLPRTSAEMTALLLSLCRDVFQAA